MKVFDVFADALQVYCEKNNLDFNKVKSSPKCGNEMMLFIQHVKSTDVGLEKNEPAEVLLFAHKNEAGNILIEKYEAADKYLHIEKAS